MSYIFHILQRDTVKKYTAFFIVEYPITWKNNDVLMEMT